MNKYSKLTKAPEQEPHHWIEFRVIPRICNFFFLKGFYPSTEDGLVGRVFTNGLEELGSIPGQVILKTLKIVLDTSLLNTQCYKVRIKGKVEQSWERSSALP